MASQVLGLVSIVSICTRGKDGLFLENLHWTLTAKGTETGNWEYLHLRYDVGDCMQFEQSKLEYPTMVDCLIALTSFLSSLSLNVSPAYHGSRAMPPRFYFSFISVTGGIVC